MLFLVENCTYIYRNNQYHNFSVWFMDIFSLVFTLLKFRIPEVNGIIFSFHRSGLDDYRLHIIRKYYFIIALIHVLNQKPYRLTVHFSQQFCLLKLAICWCDINDADARSTVLLGEIGWVAIYLLSFSTEKDSLESHSPTHKCKANKQQPYQIIIGNLVFVYG